MAIWELESNEAESLRSLPKPPKAKALHSIRIKSGRNWTNGMQFGSQIDVTTRAHVCCTARLGPRQRTVGSLSIQIVLPSCKSFGGTKYFKFVSLEPRMAIKPQRAASGTPSHGPKQEYQVLFPVRPDLASFSMSKVFFSC